MNKIQKTRKIELTNILAQKLKIARFQNSFSIKDLSNKTDISMKTLESIETGNILPSLDILQKVCHELKLNYYKMKELLDQIVELNSKTVADYMKNAREQKNFTQKELAEKLGISNSFVSKIEKGQSFPSRKLLKQICLLLELDYNEMLIKLTKEKKNK